MKNLPSEGIPVPGTYHQSTDIRVDLFKRTYLVHVPTGYGGDTPVPLMVVLHGAFSTGEDMHRDSGFSSLADREGFIVLYPNGIGLFGWLRHWNSGHCCGRAKQAQVDDVAFVEAVVEEVRGRLLVDPGRIYVAGHSNGGMLAYRLAAEKSEKFAAAAAVSATIGGKPSVEEAPWQIPAPAKPVPVIVIHGKNDDKVPYDGGPDPRSDNGRTWMSIADSVAFWRKHNGCKEPAATKRLGQGRVLVQTWSDAQRRAPVGLYILEDWGHGWPGASAVSAMGSNPLKGFDAAEAIWDFVKDYRRTQ